VADAVHRGGTKNRTVGDCEPGLSGTWAEGDVGETKNRTVGDCEPAPVGREILDDDVHIVDGGARCLSRRETKNRTVGDDCERARNGYHRNLTFIGDGSRASSATACDPG